MTPQQFAEICTNIRTQVGRVLLGQEEIVDNVLVGVLARDIGAQMVIPCHYEMFEFNTASPDDFVTAAKNLGQPHQVLRSGEHWNTAELN